MHNNYKIILLLSLFFFSCKEREKKISKYKNIPTSIKYYLDSISNGKFLIADIGQEWEGGCLISGHLPRKKFISATVSKEKFTMKFWQGGFVETKEEIIIGFNADKITSYKLKDLE